MTCNLFILIVVVDMLLCNFELFFVTVGGVVGILNFWLFDSFYKVVLSVGLMESIEGL